MSVIQEADALFALNWLYQAVPQECLQHQLSAVNIADQLKSGVILTSLLNSLSPNLLPTAVPEQPEVNIQNFLNGCQALGMPADQLFTVSDLLEGKDLGLVFRSLTTLASIIKQSEGTSEVAPNTNVLDTDMGDYAIPADIAYYGYTNDTNYSYPNEDSAQGQNNTVGPTPPAPPTDIAPPMQAPDETAILAPDQAVFPPPTQQIAVPPPEQAPLPQNPAPPTKPLPTPTSPSNVAPPQPTYAPPQTLANPPAPAQTAHNTSAPSQSSTTPHSTLPPPLTRLTQAKIMLPTPTEPQQAPPTVPNDIPPPFDIPPPAVMPPPATDFIPPPSASPASLTDSGHSSPSAPSSPDPEPRTTRSRSDDAKVTLRPLPVNLSCSDMSTFVNNPTKEKSRRPSMEEVAFKDDDSSSGGWRRASFFSTPRGSGKSQKESPSGDKGSENQKLRGEIKNFREQMEISRKRASAHPERLAVLDQFLKAHEPVNPEVVSHDPACENTYLKLERNYTFYQLCTLKTMVSMADELVNAKTTKDMLQKMCSDLQAEVRKVEIERKATQAKLEEALSVKTDYVSEEGLLFVVDKKNPDKQEIKGGTVEKLVERFRNDVESKLSRYILAHLSKLYRCPCHPKNDTQSVVKNTVFRLTLRSFDDTATPPEEVGDQSVAAQQRVLNKKKTRLRICNLLRRWTENYFHDFLEDPQLLNEYKSFVETNVKDGAVALLKSGLEKKTAAAGQLQARSYVFSKDPPPPIMPSKISLEDVDAVEIARQLTLQEFDMFLNIQAKELLSLSWSKKDKEKRSPNLLSMIHRFNAVSNWVTLNIVREQNLRKRVPILRKLELLKLNNLNAVFEFSAGLNSSAVLRMKNTWAEAKDSQKVFERISAITVPQGSYAAFRETLHNANPPCIPYLGVYLSDLTFIGNTATFTRLIQPEEGNQDLVDNTYVHFVKFRMVANVIQEIQQYQQKPYNLIRVDQIQQWLATLEGATEKECFEMSLVAEPRQPTAT